MWILFNLAWVSNKVPSIDHTAVADRYTQSQPPRETINGT